MKKAVVITVAAVLVLGATLVGIKWWQLKKWAATAHAGQGRSLAVEIPRGAGPGRVAHLLAEAGVIDDAERFAFYLRRVRRAAGQIKSGELALRDDMTPDQVIAVLREGTPFTYKITIPEGLRSDEVAAIYEKRGLADASRFLARCRDRDFVRSLGVPGKSLEGFLFPDTYRFRKSTPLDDILRTMVKHYQDVFAATWRRRAAQLGMSELQVVTLASIIEKETGAARERALISGVFHNRLREGWKLQTDPSVIYAVLLERGHFDGNLTREDLRIDNPYNTYRYPGLPPGPICNPGADALRAALWPKATGYFFFVSRNDGTHEFCATLACHNRAVKRYQGGG